MICEFRWVAPRIEAPGLADVLHVCVCEMNHDGEHVCACRARLPVDKRVDKPWTV